MLSGKEILRQVELGNIIIDPFDPAQLNPNSYNCRLGKEVAWLDEVLLDLHLAPRVVRQEIGSNGYRLFPGMVLLGHTIEVIGSDIYVPCIDGRSTCGRYGLAVHITAGFGDIGFQGQYCMELESRHRPILLREGDLIAQVSFRSVEGEIELYKGSYQNQTGPREPKPLK